MVSAAQQANLMQWLSKRPGKNLKVQVLAAQGYELVGGQLLSGGGSSARAQFMFQNPAGTRVTLYLRALNDKPAPGATAPRKDPGQAAWRYSTEGPVAFFLLGRSGFRL